VTPPVSPPALLVRCTQRPLSPRPSMTSCTDDPNRRVCSKPRPNSTPFTMLMLMTAAASAASSRRSQWTYEPRPMGRPCATTSKTPPTVSPAERASSIRAIIAVSASGSGQRNGEASASSRDRVALAGSRATPPTSAVNDQTSMPSSRRKARATAPAATRAAVSRADARSSTFRTSLKPYLSAPARSAWPGRTLVTGVARLLPPSAAAASSAASMSERGPTCMTRVQFSQSRLRTSSRMGDPSVRPWRTPPRISARSCSMAWRAPRP